MRKNGSNAQLMAEAGQERAFESMMCFQEDRVREKEFTGGLRIPLAEYLKIKQPAAAWTLGWMAGWPEMRNA